MKRYLRPVTDIINDCLMDHLLGASVPKGDRYTRWGNGDPNEPYGNPDWVNEGYDPNTIVMGGDDDGETDSRGKEWGDLWGDWGF